MSMESIGLKKNFVALDALRTMLALSVAVGHYIYWNNLPSVFPRTFFLAVDFFFVLSGFVLTQSVFNDKSLNFKYFIRSFLIRRWFRLYPLYIILSVFWVVVIAWEHIPNGDPFNFYAVSIFLLQGVGFAAKKYIFVGSIGIAWSVSVEFWIASLFFSLVYLLRAHRKTLFLICALIAFFGMFLMVQYGPGTMDATVFQKLEGVFTFGSVRGAIGFAFGSICYIFYSVLKNVKIPACVAVTTAFEVLLIFVIFFLFVKNDHIRNNEFFAPILFSLLILALSLDYGYVAKTLNSRILAPFRPLSYSIYLVHPIWILAWPHLGLPLTQKGSIIYALATLLTAPLFYKKIECHFIKKGRNATEYFNRCVSGAEMQKITPLNWQGIK